MTATISLHANGYERKQSYDYLICATGYRRIWPTVPQSLDRNSYLEEARGHIDHVKFAEHAVVVIGGGELLILSLRHIEADDFVRCGGCRDGG